MNTTHQSTTEQEITQDTAAKRKVGRPKKSAACAECAFMHETSEGLKQHSRETGHYFSFKIAKDVTLRVCWNSEGMYFPKLATAV